MNHYILFGCTTYALCVRSTSRSEDQVKQVYSHETYDQAHAKLVKIFRYLQAFNQLNNPVQREISDQPWVMWFYELPDHPCIRRGAVASTISDIDEEDTNNLTRATKDTASPDGNFLLKVSRPELTDAPRPPGEVTPWLQNDWQHIDGKVIVEPAIETNVSEQKRVLRFDDDPRRQQLLEEWKVRRNNWVETERPARQAMTIFEDLYKLQAQIERESERLELMLGDGVLTWQGSEGISIHHPILLMRLQLLFDPEVPEFTLVETEQPPELYTALCQCLPDANATALGYCRDDLDKNSWHPLGGEETTSFLRRLVTQFSFRGKLVSGTVPQRDKDIPYLERSPVLFLRRRTLGLSIALDSILEDLPDHEHLPYSLTSIVGIEPPMNEILRFAQDDIVQLDTSPNGEDEDILFSKPANAEQLEIARRLERQGAVLVQGPPGTGKTHTIANLLGHLLSQGKRVLVTSHTAKALKVLRSQVVEALQPLCVSVLTDDNKQMESTVDAISERLASSNPDRLEGEAAILERERSELLRQLRESRARLGEARHDEYRAIVVAGKEIPPSQAARYIATKREIAGWIPAPVELGEPLPLSVSDLVELYRSNAAITAKDEQEMTLSLPDLNKLVAPGEFERLVTERARLLKEKRDYRYDLWQDIAANHAAEALEKLEKLKKRLMQEIGWIGNASRWQLAALEAGREGGPRYQAWNDLIADIEGTYALANQAQPLLFKYNPLIPEDCLPGREVVLKDASMIERRLRLPRLPRAPLRCAEVLSEILAHLKSGGNLKGLTLLLHKDWKTLIEQARVNGQHPEILEHFAALHMLVCLKGARAYLVERWQRQMSVLGAPDGTALGPEPERACMQYTNELRRCLQWFPTTWVVLVGELMEHGLRWDAFLAEMPVSLAEYGEIARLHVAVTERLPAIIAAEIERREYKQNRAKLSDLYRQLESIGGNEAKAGVAQRMLAAVKGLHVQAYREVFNKLAALYARRETLQRRYALLGKLEKVAPAWAAAIRYRQGVHGKPELPGSPEDAWRWRQLHDELERRGQTSLEELQERIAQLSTDLQRVTASLVEKKSWAWLANHTTLEQRQALQGWKALMKKVGKGTGKRAPRLLAEARKLIPICQAAIPVWIMPLSRVMESFDPRCNRFDVVIIDEASQADLTALAAVYMGRQVVVVGDHEQVSPVAIGQKLDEVQYLIDEHLQGIPNAALYDGKFSIYELAQTTFPPVCLREHFRCVPSIIQFSNALSYQGKIKPLRDASEVRRLPPTVAYRVKSSEVEGHINEEEALAVTSLLVAATEQPEYREATFGVISMVSNEQAMYIDTLLRRYLPIAEYARHRVQCGNAAQFQGDERDVMFLSLVDVPKGDGPLPLRGEGADDIYKKRFNVAASRARDQMWVVHSVDPDTDLKPGDLRYRLIQHAKDPGALTCQLDSQEQHTESEFEKQVLRRLVQAGYRVIPQWPVGAYRIDLVVEGAGKRLAVECDGDRWHPKEKLEEDMARQAILERLGWRFVRIRGSQFFRYPAKAMEAVFSRLQAFDIPPVGVEVAETSRGQAREELRMRIVRRAAELRRQWVEAG